MSKPQWGTSGLLTYSQKVEGDGGTTKAHLEASASGRLDSNEPPQVHHLWAQEEHSERVCGWPGCGLELLLHFSSLQHFVSERKYDEELGKAARFSCDIEQLKAQIMICGESELCIGHAY